MTQYTPEQKAAVGSGMTLKTLSKYDLEIPIAVCFGIGGIYVFNKRLVEDCLFISYRDPTTGLYDKGPADVCVVLTWAVLLTLTRAILKTGLFLPVAVAWKLDPSKLDRFSEQCWNLAYYVPSWTVGMYMAYNSPYWMNTINLWVGYPHLPLTAMMKSYYLVQSAFWLHQLLLLNLEKRRKDHYPMMLHHILTLTLLSGGYFFNFIRIGNVVMVITDLADLILPLAKIFNYLKFRLACDVMFGLFAITWILTRHVLFGYLIYSIAVETWPYVDWNPAEEKYLSAGTIYTFLGLFICLQLIIFYWLLLILKVAWKLVSGAAPAHDNRESDSE